MSESAGNETSCRQVQKVKLSQKTVWVGMCHLSVEQIQIYIYIYMDKDRIPRTPRGRENGLGGHVPSYYGTDTYIYIYTYIYICINMDKNGIPRTPRGRENGLGGHVPS